ncbi:response regulator transcription factor [Roseomonas sp. AR75]|uniref:response regulator n=1 Tax=Roseomonas sp. AR75 TaxID=2562311 RepID=UPI0010C05580|nr:response regulator transcription factor [Roseomonas sp. AR75]
MRILLVEDDPALGRAVRAHLTLSGHAVDLVASRSDADAALRMPDHALVLLDLGLPDGSGLDVLRALRGRDDWRPVIVLTARDQITDRIEGLKAGADDYVVKPFDLDELHARIHAVARRAGGRPGREFRSGEVVLNLEDRHATVGGAEVALTAREWAILERLLQRPGATVSREQIAEAIYRYGDEVESNTVEVYVSRIRRKLGSELIDTLRGVGYRARA